MAGVDDRADWTLRGVPGVRRVDDARHLHAGRARGLSEDHLCAGYPQQVGFMPAPHMPMPQDSFGLQVPPPSALRVHSAGHHFLSQLVSGGGRVPSLSFPDQSLPGAKPAGQACRLTLLAVGLAALCSCLVG